jgi:hypothetical protein
LNSTNQARLYSHYSDFYVFILKIFYQLKLEVIKLIFNTPIMIILSFANSILSLTLFYLFNLSWEILLATLKDTLIWLLLGLSLFFLKPEFLLFNWKVYWWLLTFIFFLSQIRLLLWFYFDSYLIEVSINQISLIKSKNILPELSQSVYSSLRDNVVTEVTPNLVNPKWTGKRSDDSGPYPVESCIHNINDVLYDCCYHNNIGAILTL